MTALVTASDLKCTYEIKRGWFRKPAELHAVGGISFELEGGRTLAVVGESGCGKSTLARLITLIEEPSAGARGPGGSIAAPSLRRLSRMRSWPGGLMPNA